MRYYSSIAVEMALTGAVNEIVTTIVVDAVLGLPAQMPFTLVLDVGLPAEEIVTVTEVSGTSLTVTRGADSSTAIAHSAGAITRHMVTARDLREPQEHLAAAANVHGIGATAAVVGTDTAQTLTNKTVNFADNTIVGVPQASVTNLVDDLAALVLVDEGLAIPLPTAYTPTFNGFTATIGYARYVQIDKMVTAQVMVNLTSAVTDTFGIALPVTPRAGYPEGLLIGTAQGVHGASAILAGVEISASAFFVFRSATTNLWASTYPHTWASGDWASFTATYEAA